MPEYTTATAGASGITPGCRRVGLTCHLDRVDVLRPQDRHSQGPQPMARPGSGLSPVVARPAHRGPVAAQRPARSAGHRGIPGEGSAAALGDSVDASTVAAGRTCPRSAPGAPPGATTRTAYLEQRPSQLHRLRHFESCRRRLQMLFHRTSVRLRSDPTEQAMSEQLVRRQVGGRPRASRMPRNACAHRVIGALG